MVKTQPLALNVRQIHLFNRLGVSMSFKSYNSWFKAVILLSAGYILLTVTSIYLPIIISLILAFILNPLVNYLCRVRLYPTQLRISRGIAVIVAFLCTTLLVAMIGTFVVLPFIHEFDKFIIDLPAMIGKIQDIISNIEQRASVLEIPANVNGIIQQTVASAASFSADLARRILQTIFGFASSIVQLIVVPVLTYYFLKDWLILKEKIIVMFAVESRNQARSVIEEMAIVISGYIHGQVLISIVIGFIVFNGMYLMHIDYPLVLGLLAACTETIPIVGPIIGSVPAIMLAYLVSPALACKVILFYIVVHQLENHIIVPNIMGHTIALHPVIVIISLLVGGQVFGIIGMMMAVPAAALLRVLVRQLWKSTER